MISQVLSIRAPEKEKKIGALFYLWVQRESLSASNYCSHHF